MQANFFALKSEVSKGIRQGLLYGKISTPNYLTLTRKGCVPTIPPEHFDYLGLKLFQYSFADIASFQDILSSFKDHCIKKDPAIVPEQLHTLARYTAQSDDSFSYLSFGDLVNAKIQGENKEDTLEIISDKHKETVTAHTYSRFVALANPHIFVTPSEIVDAAMGRKRRVRVAKQSIKFLNNCIKARNELKFEQCKLIAPVITKSEEVKGSPEIFDVLKTLEVDGFLYCGISPLKDEKFEAITGINEALKEKASKLRIYQSDGDLTEVIFGILNGVDLFEASFPVKLAEAMFAIESIDPGELTTSPLSESAKEDLNKMLLQKRVKCVDFNEKKQKELILPIQKDCECFACKNHTRAYISHMIECNELNWLMLLTIHNMHSYEMFFRKARDMIREGLFDRFAYEFLSKCCEDK